MMNVYGMPNPRGWSRWSWGRSCWIFDSSSFPPLKSSCRLDSWRRGSWNALGQPWSSPFFRFCSRENPSLNWTCFLRPTKFFLPVFVRWPTRQFHLQNFYDRPSKHRSCKKIGRLFSLSLRCWNRPRIPPANRFKFVQLKLSIPFFWSAGYP